MAGAVNIRLGAIVTDFVAGFRAAGAAAGQLITTLNGNLSAGFAAADRQSRQFERGIGQLGRTIQSFGRQASLVTAGIALISATSFKTYADINALQLGLENITGSAAGAKARFNELLPVVRLPGLGLEEAIKGDVRLRAVGFSAQQSKDALLQFGNALALTGGGKFELDSILTQLTQMGSKARVTSDDLKPIINSSAAVGKAVREMFGVVDSEQISAKLQAAGRSPMDFINDLTAKLSQLERVKGGPKNALENLGDALKLAQFNFGEAADKAFGLSGIIDDIGNAATDLADRFAALSPTTQKVILTVTGLVAAFGPLAVAVGGLLALVPAITAGAAAITTTLGIAIGPILLIGAAIVGVAVLVATNWSSVKTILTDSGIWQTLTGLVNSAFGAIRAAFSATVALAQVLWARFGGFFTSIAKTAFEGVVAIFKFNAGLLQGIFGFLSGVLTLNWREALNGLLNIAKSFWNLLIDGFKLVAGGVGQAISATFQLFGGTSIADRITAGIDKALVKVDGLKGSIQSVQTVAKAGVTLNVATGAKNAVKAPTVKPFDYTNVGGDSAIEALKKQQKAAKEAVGSFKAANPGKAVPTELLQNYQTLTDRLKEATSETRNYGKAVKVAKESQFGDVESLKRLEKYLESTIQLAKGKGVEEQVQQLKSVREQIEKLDALTSKDQKLNITGIKELANPATSSRVNSIVDSFHQMATIAPGLFDKPAVTRYLTEFQKLLPSADYYQSKIQEIQEVISKLSFNGFKIPQTAINDLAKYKKIQQDAQDSSYMVDVAVDNKLGGDMPQVSAIEKVLGQLSGGKQKIVVAAQEVGNALSEQKKFLADSAAGFLSGIGESIGKGENPLKTALKSIIGFLADYAIRIGTAALIGSKALLLAAPFLAGTTLPQGIGLQVTGAGLIIAGGAIKGLGNFAKGGLFTSSSVIRVGESSRATSGGLGEWVSPVGLGANLIGDRIMKRLANDTQFNRPDMSRVGRQSVDLNVSGNFNLRNGDLSASIDDYQSQNSYFN